MLVLASSSPRRSELLRNAGISFVVKAADVDETVRSGENPEEYVVRVAVDKAMAVASEAGDTVLGADTTVVIDGEILGKPVDNADAERMLQLLQGRRHDVITGICVKKGNDIVRDWAATKVWFAPMSEDQIREYVASGEPVDKAGAYAIQGLASKFIEKIDGSYSNVVGLPVALVYKHILRIDG
jgi:septum formation protein